MKLLGVFISIFALSFLAQGGAASAQTPRYNNQLKVTGVVLPAQHVIVNNQGIITEILSNTNKDVKPKVYINNISKQTTIELTPEIYEQYRHLVPEGQSHVGTLYKRTPGTYMFTPLESLTTKEITSPALPSPISHDLD